MSFIAINSCSKDPVKSIVYKNPNLEFLLSQYQQDSLTKDEFIAVKVKKKGTYKIEEEEAKKMLAEFRGDLTKSGNKVIKSSKLKKSRSNQSLYYEMEFSTKGGGYAIVSADERVPEVLCFVEQGQIEDTINNPILKEYFRMVAFYVESNTRRDLNLDSLCHSFKKKNAEMLTKSLPAFDPNVWTYQMPVYRIDSIIRIKTVPVKWGQSAPFDISPAGCSSVAVAQVMAYHKKAYKDIVLGSSMWNAMIQNNLHSAIPVLLEDIKDDLYWFFNSITPFMSGVRSLLQDNGYSMGDICKEYNFDIILEALKYGPTIISGMESLTSGHYWVIDGVKKTTHYSFDLYTYQYGNKVFEHYDLKYVLTPKYVHFNWGWRGQHDGWYSSNVFSYIDNDATMYDERVRILESIQ
ncbi:MAG: C10 family peptidase [Bacteroidales bacterium]